MNTRTKTLAFILSLAGTASIAFLLAWLFSLEGTKGLGEWGWNKVFIGIAVLGILPLFLTLPGLPGFRDPSSRLSSVSAIASMATGTLALLLALGLFGFLFAKSHALPVPPPALNLVDPGKGLVPAEAGKLRIALSSDPHWGAVSANASARTSILEGVAAEKPARDAFFILGDNTERGLEAGPWAAEAAELSAKLGAVPARPLIGNHDALLGGQWHYSTYFFPKGFSSDTGSPYWYAMDSGPARIVVLDLLWGAEDFNAGKRAWLEATLASTPPEKRIIVLTHCFLASSGYMDGNEPWFDHYGTLAEVAPILERHKVDLVVQGHNHYMEFLVKDGVSYATVGAMGGKPDPVPTHVSPWSKWFLRGTYGWLDLEASRAGIDLTFKDSDGKTLHTERVPATR